MATTKTSKTAEKHDALLAEQELLSSVPRLKPAAAFRQRDKSNLNKLAVQLMDFVDDEGNVDTTDAAAASALFDFLADADDFFETIAADHDEYIAWSTGLRDSEEIFGALVGKYQRELGE
ncbi:hypothetical protein ACFWHR_03875 [Leucobacter sp. NPDC058333]|uniref:hypothetical protein n=1 Tax=Leucobacter sp. NPDC058333 TaxID=3346450 RepID=UPI003646C51B